MLPQLPKKRKHEEADITPDVMDWFFNNWPNDVAVEVKVDKNKAKEHQTIALEQVQRGEFKRKIPDLGRQNPFDFFILKKADAFLVTCEGKKCLVEHFGELDDFYIEV